MQFEKINLNTLHEKHFFSNIPYTYSMTVKLDITNIRKQKIKLYPAIFYYITTIMNRHAEFRTSFLTRTIN